MKRILLVLCMLILSFSLMNSAKATEKTADMLKKNVVTEGDGLYKDTTIEGRYIYRGGNPNNYIKLSNALYRIISVEKDGTIKVIRQDSIGFMAFDEKNARLSEDSNDFCTGKYGCKAWGSNTTTLDSNGNKVTQMPLEINGTLKNLPEKEATLNIYLNNDFYNSLSDGVKKAIVKKQWNIGPTSADQTNLSESIKEEVAYKWKGKVALMNVTDFAKASSVSECLNVKSYDNSACSTNANSHNYLYLDNFSSLLSLFDSSNSSSVFDFYKGTYGIFGFDSTNAYYAKSVNPSFYLSTNISLNGNGTKDKPYTLINDDYSDEKENIQYNNLPKIIDVIKKKVVTAGDGIYKDTYQEERYVYKGGKPNNFIKFNNELWRIMAIEKDGTIKIIRNNALNAPLIFEFPSNDRGTYCKTGDFYDKERYECNAWGKIDNFSDGYYSGSVTDDTYLNKYLNNEYLNTMSDDAKYKIVDHDFGIGGVIDADWRTSDVTAQDAIKDENKYIWKGKVGLGTASDILNASSNVMCESMEESRYDSNYCFATNYLLPSLKYKYTDYNYLLMTPVSGSRSTVFGASMSGLYSQDVHSYDDAYGYAYYTRPVVYLNSDVQLVSGDGGKENPYVLKAEKNDTNSSISLPTQVVNVPSTSSFVSAVIIGGAIILLIISLGVYIKVFKKKSIN